MAGLILLIMMAVVLSPVRETVASEPGNATIERSAIRSHQAGRVSRNEFSAADEENGFRSEGVAQAFLQTTRPWLRVRPAVARIVADPTAVAKPPQLFAPISSVTIGGQAGSTEQSRLEQLQLADLESQRTFADNWGSAPLAGFSTAGKSARPWRLSVPVESAPLYFEQPDLERCGASLGVLTTGYSALSFATDLAMLPASMVRNPPGSTVQQRDDKCQCGASPTNGHEVSVAEILAEGGVITALFLIVP